tara:strand:- start:45824 stop:46960 length:1137 start_codon:yes stop_codon:yes gene_type:complete
MQEKQFIPRMQKNRIEEKLSNNKLLLIQGPKRVGKKTLIEEVLVEKNCDYTLYDCSEKKTKKQLQKTIEFSGTKQSFIVLYEAQYLPNLGNILEAVLSGKIVATVVIICSYKPQINSDLLEAINQAELCIDLFAPSFYESAQFFGLPNEEKLLEERLVFGSYPEVIGDLVNANASLQEIIKEAIFANLSAKERINKSDQLMRMLQILAFNIGENLSYNEIAIKCQLDNETVERYIDLLGDAFILIRLKSFNNGNRYELKKSNMIYFTDNGIRNALINNLNPTFLRDDMNALWRNYVIAERIKWMRMTGILNESYFWKTTTNQELDFLEIKENKIFAYKTDWEKRKKIKFPRSFEESYPEAKTSVINRSTYWSFLTQKK